MNFWTTTVINPKNHIQHIQSKKANIFFYWRSWRKSVAIFLTDLQVQKKFHAIGKDLFYPKILCTGHVIAVGGDAQTYAQLDDFKQKLNLEWRRWWLLQGDGVLPTASSHT
jgi:hypothetical protein